MDGASEVITFTAVTVGLTALLAVADRKYLAAKWPGVVTVPVAFGSLGVAGYMALSKSAAKVAALPTLVACTSAATAALVDRATQSPAQVVVQAPVKSAGVSGWPEYVIPALAGR